MPAIGDLFVKLGRQEPLTPGEIDSLRLEMNRIQATTSVVASWLTGGTSDPHFSAIYADAAHITLPWIRVQDDTDLVVSDNTETPILAATADVKIGPGFSWSSADPTKIRQLIGPKVFIMFMECVWAGNATGLRTMTANMYNSADNSVGGITMQEIPSVSASSITLSTAIFARTAGAVAYVIPNVKQTSGGDLTLLAVRFAAVAFVAR
jgi:hypothetical protein